MAKRLTARQKQQRASQRKQERLTAEYHRLLTQTKNVFHDANVGKYGVSFEKFVKSLGTSTGLKKPTQKSIKALKKAQTQEQVLKLARREVLMKRYSAQQHEELQELSQRIKEQEVLNGTDKGFEKAVTETIRQHRRDVKNFIIQLDNVIALLSHRVIPNRARRGTISETGKTSRATQILRNANKLKHKLLDLFESAVQGIRQSQSEDDEDGVLYYLEKLEKLAESCATWCTNHNTIEFTLLYDENYDAFEALIIPSDLDFV